MSEKPRQYFPGESEGSDNAETRYQPSYQPGPSQSEDTTFINFEQNYEPTRAQPQYYASEKQAAASPPASPVPPASSAAASYPEPPTESRGAGMGIVMGVLFLVCLIAAIAMFFLWRDAVGQADKPTETTTETTVITHTETTTAEPTTVTVTTTEAPVLPPEVIDNLPQVPDGVAEDADRVRQFLDDVVSNLGN